MMKFAIIGTGIMGRGWITQCTMTGHEAHCYDGNKEILAGTIDASEKLTGKVAKKFKIDDPDFVSKAVKNITTYEDKGTFMEAAKGCDVFLEVIFEDLKLKCTVLSELLPQLPDNVVFWSNTSSLDINPMAEAGGRPDRSIITHGMNPVPMMPGVEVVPGAKTNAETVEFTRQTLLDMKKAPFLAPNIPGFWVNRLLVHTSLGHPQGTFKLHDFVTAPTMLRVALQMYQASNDPRMYPPLTLMRMVKNGEFGASSGAGFYDWSDPRNPKARDLSQYVIGSAEDMTDSLK
jgi:3-hydroxyacyl-CoA dehydrogenase